MEWKINGTDVRTPTGFSWSLQDIESGESGRSTNDGKSNVDIIAQKRSISCKWNDPTPEEVSSILLLVNQHGTVELRYPDALSNTYETREFKTLKRIAPVRNFRVGAKMYSELSFDFEEI